MKVGLDVTRCSSYGGYLGQWEEISAESTWLQRISPNTGDGRVYFVIEGNILWSVDAAGRAWHTKQGYGALTWGHDPLTPNRVIRAFPAYQVVKDPRPARTLVFLGQLEAYDGVD
jgi:hypothetical protein